MNALLAPIPSDIALETVPAAADTVMTWQYTLDRKGLSAIYEKAKVFQWNAATDIDWSLEVDPDAPARGYTARMMNAIMSPPVLFCDRGFKELTRHRRAWMLSQFLHGEQGALLAASQLVGTAPNLEAKLCAAQQANDEARHVEVYRRYLTTKLGISYPVNPQLRTLLRQVVGDRRWDIALLGMQVLIEGLALAAFEYSSAMDPDDKLLEQITSYVVRDEARHVGFGILSLQEAYADLTSAERREREEFVVEASILLRDRFLMEEVWESLGLDKRVWTKWALTAPFMVEFRRVLFGKIVPNLHRLGLLTPYVRSHLKRLGVLDESSALAKRLAADDLTSTQQNGEA